MSVPRWLVVSHVVTISGLLGSDLALLALGIRGLAGAEGVWVYPAMHTLAAWLLRPLALAAIATGLAAAVRGRSLRRGWVLTKLGITVALALLVILVAEPGLATAATGTVTDRTRTTYAVVPVATAALLLVNVVLGVRHRILESPTGDSGAGSQPGRPDSQPTPSGASTDPRPRRSTESPWEVPRMVWREGDSMSLLRL